MGTLASRNSEIAARYAAGEGPSSLARRFGVTRQRIHAITARSGVVPPPKHRSRSVTWQSMRRQL